MNPKLSLPIALLATAALAHIIIENASAQTANPAAKTAPKADLAGKATKANAATRSPFASPKSVRKTSAGAPPRTTKPTARIVEVTAVKAKSAAKVAPKITKPTAARSARIKPAQTAASAPKAAVKQTSPMKSATKQVRERTFRFVVMDRPDKNNVVPAISEDFRFVYLRLTPESALTKDEATLLPTDLVEGIELDCAGAWHAFETDHFTVKLGRAAGRLDDFAMRKRIAEACKSLSRARPAYPNQATGAPAAKPAGTAVASAPTATPTRPTTDGAATPAVKSEDRPVGQPGEKPTEKPVEKPVEKPGNTPQP
jgi:hypothetical protein